MVKSPMKTIGHKFAHIAENKQIRNNDTRERSQHRVLSVGSQSSCVPVEADAHERTAWRKKRLIRGKKLLVDKPLEVTSLVLGWVIVDFSRLDAFLRFFSPMLTSAHLSADRSFFLVLWIASEFVRFKLFNGFLTSKALVHKKKNK